MKESYREALAMHPGPESCGGIGNRRGRGSSDANPINLIVIRIENSAISGTDSLPKTAWRNS